MNIPVFTLPNEALAILALIVLSTLWAVGVILVNHLVSPSNDPDIDHGLTLKEFDAMPRQIVGEKSAQSRQPRSSQ